MKNKNLIRPTIVILQAMFAFVLVSAQTDTTNPAATTTTPTTGTGTAVATTEATAAVDPLQGPNGVIKPSTAYPDAEIISTCGVKGCTGTGFGGQSMNCGEWTVDKG